MLTHAGPNVARAGVNLGSGGASCRWSESMFAHAELNVARPGVNVGRLGGASAIDEPNLASAGVIVCTCRT